VNLALTMHGWTYLNAPCDHLTKKPELPAYNVQLKKAESIAESAFLLRSAHLRIKASTGSRLFISMASVDGYR
jgi:hypothetical protein